MIFIVNEDEININVPLQAIYFYASWMPYHNKFLVMIDKIQEKYKNLVFLAIDVDQFSNQCKRFSIESIPTVLIMKDGQEVKRINGLVLTSAFKRAFADICSSDTQRE